MVMNIDLGWAKGILFYLDELIAGSRLYEDNKTLGDRKKVHEEILQMQRKNFRKSSKQMDL